MHHNTYKYTGQKLKKKNKLTLNELKKIKVNLF